MTDGYIRALCTPHDMLCTTFIFIYSVCLLFVSVVLSANTVDVYEKEGLLYLHIYVFVDLPGLL